MSRSLLDDWEYDIRRCCREDIPMEMMNVAEDIYNTAYTRGKNHSVKALDKIKAEIEQDAFKDENGSKYIFVNRVNQILDKHKAENEE